MTPRYIEQSACVAYLTRDCSRATALIENKKKFRLALLALWVILFIPWCIYSLSVNRGGWSAIATVAIGTTVVVLFVSGMWKTGLWAVRGRQSGLKSVFFVWLKTLGAAVIVVGVERFWQGFR